MANVEKRGESYRVRWRERGQEKQRTFDTWSEARDWRDQLRAQHAPVRRGRKIRVDPAITVADFGKWWLQQIEPPAVKPATWASYDQNLRLHIFPELGERRVRELNEGHVLQLLELKLRQERPSRRKPPKPRPPGTPGPKPRPRPELPPEPRRMSMNTVRIIHSTLRRMLTRARLEGIVPTNVALGVFREVTRIRPKKRKNPDEVKALTEEQLDQLLAAGRAEPRWWLLWYLMSRSGLRPGEACALELDHVDVRGRTLSVEGTLHAPRKGQDRVGTPKSGERRTVRIGRALADELAGALASRREQNLARGWGAAPWLFVTSEGTPVDEKRMRSAWKRAVRAAHLPNRFAGPHSLRHTYATLALRAGRPITWVSTQLGHASPEVTLNWWYWWALPEPESGAADFLDTDTNARLAAR